MRLCVLVGELLSVWEERKVRLKTLTFTSLILRMTLGI